MIAWIRLSATKNGDCLWDAEAGLPIDPTTLSISDKLRTRLDEWKNRYVQENFDPDSDAFDDFAADGEAIAEALKSELPTCRVNYHNLSIEAGAPPARQPSADNSKPWDYEIE